MDCNVKKKKRPCLKFTLKMILWMFIGGILGFSFAWFGTQTEQIGQFFAEVVNVIREMMGILILAVTIGGIIFGEITLKKLKRIGAEILHAEDELCDELEYQEEKIGGRGINGSNLAMALAVLITSTGYSGSYISRSADTAVHFTIAMLLFLVCFFYEGIWQMRYVKVVQSRRPEFAEADPSSVKFQKQWLDSCDEAEKEMIYQSSYHTYMFLSKAVPITMVIAMLANLLFETGMLAIVLLAVLWIMMSMYYTHSCITMRKKRARGA